MPSYFSVEVSFKKDIIYPGFVKDIYSTFFQSGFSFKSGYWEGKDMTLEQIIDWNQRLLQNKFRLELTQHVKHDYKQILFNTDIYDEMRLFWMYIKDKIHLTLIVPEFDVLNLVENYSFLIDKVNPLIDIARNLWSTGMVAIIQSCLELDTGGFDIEQIEQGQLPCINPFCILNEDIAKKFIPSIKGKTVFQSLNNNGILIIDNSLISA